MREGGGGESKVREVGGEMFVTLWSLVLADINVNVLMSLGDVKLLPTCMCSRPTVKTARKV